MNYEKDIAIDDEALDIEWLEQPTLMLKYGKHQAQTQKNLDDAEEQLDYTVSELDSKIRQTPSRFGIPKDTKITEAVIKAAVLMQPSYKKCQESVIEKRFENNTAKNALKAFEQRKEALENLVKPYGQNYFAGPKMPRDIHEEREQRKEQQDSTNKRISSGLKRK